MNGESSGGMRVPGEAGIRKLILEIPVTAGDVDRIKPKPPVGRMGAFKNRAVVRRVRVVNEKERIASEKESGRVDKPQVGAPPEQGNKKKDRKIKQKHRIDLSSMRRLEDENIAKEKKSILKKNKTKIGINMHGKKPSGATKRKSAEFTLKDRLQYLADQDVEEDGNVDELHLLLRTWFETLNDDKVKFHSPFLETHVKLTEAIELTRSLKKPNPFLSAVACNMLGELTPYFRQYTAIIREAHALLFDVIYDENQTPYYSKTKDLEKVIADLEKCRRAYVVRRNVMLEEEQRQRKMFEESLEDYEYEITRKTFLAWKKWVIINKRHLGKMQILFPKRWRAEERLQFYFSQWYKFKEAQVDSKLDTHLDQGNADMAYHEKGVADKKRILNKKKAHEAAVELEFQNSNETITKMENKLAAEVDKVEKIKLEMESLGIVHKQLSRLAESLGQNVFRTCQNILKFGSRTYDARLLVLQRGSEDSDMLLEWVKLVLGKYYETNEEKRVLLSSTKSMDHVVQLGMVLDLSECLPGTLQEEANNVEDAVIGADNFETDIHTNIDQLLKVKLLLKVHELCKNDDLNILNKSDEKDRGSLKSDSSFRVRVASVSGKNNLGMNAGQNSSKKLGAKPRRASIDEHMHVVEEEQEIDVFNENRPLVQIEEILRAVKMDNEDKNIFLMTFLRMFMTSCPLLNPILSESGEIYRALNAFRSEYCKLFSDMSAPENTHDRMLHADYEQPALVVSKMRNQWTEIIQLFKSRLSSLQRNSSWEKVKGQMEESIWKTLHEESRKNERKKDRRFSLVDESMLFLKQNERANRALEQERSLAIVDKETNILTADAVSEAVEAVLAKRFSTIDTGSTATVGLRFVKDDFKNLFVQYRALLTLVIVRYSFGRFITDFIYENHLITDEDIKLDTSFASIINDMNMERPEKLQVFHVVEFCFIVAEQLKGCGFDDAAFVTLMRERVLEKVKLAGVVIRGDLDELANMNTTAELCALFFQGRSKGSPVGKLSLINWNEMIDNSKKLIGKTHATKSTVLKLFEKTQSDGSNAICFNEFAKLMLQVAKLKYTNPFQTEEEKLGNLLKLLLN